MKTTHRPALTRHALSTAALAALLCPTVHAYDWEITGQVRQEIAVKTTDDQNQQNQYGNPNNGRQVNSEGLGAVFGGVPINLTRPAGFAGKADLNSLATRVEINVDGKISETLKTTIKFRGVTEQVGEVEDVFKSSNIYKREYGGTAGGNFAYARRHTLFDLPAAYIDYNSGPLWLRAGNQQIAWGEAIFFRVADVPNGLDFRNHLLDPAAEEYSDKRRSSFGLRGDYRVSEKFSVDGFAQKFAATQLPTTGRGNDSVSAPTNFISDQFTINTRDGYDDVKNKWNFGLRARGEFNGIGYQAFAVSRYNPDGVYKWTLPTAGNGGVILPGTSFEVGTQSGVYNHDEWFNSAARSRLNGIQGLDESLNIASNGFFGNVASSNPAFAGTPLAGLPALQQIAGACGAAGITLGAFNTGTRNAAACILDSFFEGGNLRGHLTRTFPRETVVGFGINKVFDGEPDSLLDQLIGRFELSYTPKKKFTNPTLGPFIESGETQFAFIAEKYHKFVSSFPATYFVLQWLHKTDSDLFGRHLGGVDNTPGAAPRGQSGGFNAVALALQQPSPTLEYRFDFAILTDLKGGWYAQPGFKWKPTKSLQVDLYGNLLYSGNKGQNKDFADGLQHNNEIFARVGFYF